MSHMISFIIVANATAAQVAALKDDIDAFFGIEREEGGLDPASIGDVHAGSAIPSHEADAGDVDAEDMPWDARIHASSKAKNEDGTWRAKRGVDKKVKAKVEADLRATLNATAPAAPVAAEPAAPGALPPVPGANVKNEYTEFVEFVVANTQPQGRLTDEWVKQVMEYHGVPGGDMQNLAHNTALIATVKDYIVKALG